ncbi:MAG: metallophosphoesterase [Bacteroidota bacterium]
MRSFDNFYILFFEAIYILVSVAAIKGLKNILKNKIRNYLIRTFIIITLLLALAFPILYLSNNLTSTSAEYKYYIVFNLLFFTDFLSKLPVAAAYAISLIIKKQKQIILWIGTIPSIALSITLITGALSGISQIDVKRIAIEFNNLPQRFDNYRIVHISDIHLGSFIGNNRVIDKTVKEITQLSPNIILFTGDLVNNFAYETEEWIARFKKLSNNYKCFSILGNHDYGNYSQWENIAEKEDNFRGIIEAHSQFGFSILRNENTNIVLNGDTISLIGVENWGHPPFPQYADLKSAMREVPDNRFKILLTHDPAHWATKVKEHEKIDLTLSGHSHGLQWGIKPAGLPFSVSYWVRKNWGGLYKSGDNYLYVNTGLGIVGMPWRIDMPAEITLITLKRSKID